MDKLELESPAALRDIDAMGTLHSLLLLVLLFGQFAVAEEESDSTDDEAMIDEITVIGAPELLALRVEIVRAEDEIYRIFNELNEDDDYDMICKHERPVGTHIARRVCRARLYRESMAEDARRAMDGDPMTGAMINTKKHNEVLQEKLRSMALEYPELAEAVQKRYVLRQKFVKAREEKFN